MNKRCSDCGFDHICCGDEHHGLCRECCVRNYGLRNHSTENQMAKELSKWYSHKCSKEAATDEDCIERVIGILEKKKADIESLINLLRS